MHLTPTSLAQPTKALTRVDPGNFILPSGNFIWTSGSEQERSRSGVLHPCWCILHFSSGPSCHFVHLLSCRYRTYEATISQLGSGRLCPACLSVCLSVCLCRSSVYTPSDTRPHPPPPLSTSLPHLFAVSFPTPTTPPVKVPYVPLPRTQEDLDLGPVIMPTLGYLDCPSICLASLNSPVVVVHTKGTPQASGAFVCGDAVIRRQSTYSLTRSHTPRLSPSSIHLEVQPVDG